MRAYLFRSRTVQAALGALALSLALFVVQLADAVILAPPPRPRATQASPIGAIQQGRRTPNHLIDGAVAAAPFTPSREPLPEAPATATERPFGAGDIQLAGTVVGDDSFALVGVGGAAPRVTRVGDRVGGYRVRSIGQGKAVFTKISDGERLELAVPRSR